MPLKPNFIERILIDKGVIPGFFIDVGLAEFKYWVVIGAMELGILEYLFDYEADIPQLARETSSSERGVQILVNALVPLGYLQARNGIFTLSKRARRSLPPNEHRIIALFFKDTMRGFAEVAAAVQDPPARGIYGWENVQFGEIGRGYQAFIRWLASSTVEEVAKKVDVPRGTRRMLDVGGSHGLYSIALCRRHPRMRATILDWPIGLEAARRTLAEHSDVAGRIDLVAADFEKDELPAGYDYVFLGNIIHGIDADGNRTLFRKLGGATVAGAGVAILDQFERHGGSPFSRGVSALMGLNLFLATGGRAYPLESVRAWLADAGFDNMKRKNLRQPGFELVTARKA